VVLLPHGYEGQGPDHSSARIERFLQLAAQDNMQIANPSIPASYFHLLRKQMSQKTKKPLIIFTPKSLLRHKLAVSSLSDIGESTSFVPVIDEVEALKNVARVLLCSGKVYYGLIEWRAQNNITNVAIIRLEQYYPFPEKELTQVLKKYNNLTDFVWCQEEPENMGAYNFVDKKISSIISKIHPNAKLTYIGRNESASPATGYLDVHNEQQTKLIQQALNI
jgi:2-oxoglutarate dehydrogenase E1 component